MIIMKFSICNQLEKIIFILNYKKKNPLNGKLTLVIQLMLKDC